MQSQQVFHCPLAYLLYFEQLFAQSQTNAPLYSEIESSGWTGVVFLSGSHILVTPLKEVREILQVQTLVPIPGVKPWLRGMATTHGEVFPVTDLAAFLTNKITKINNNTRILVVTYQEEFYGILVTRVMGLQKVLTQNNQEKSLINLGEYEPFILGTFYDENLTLPIISCNAIIQHPRFRDVALKVDE